MTDPTPAMPFVRRPTICISPACRDRATCGMHMSHRSREGRPLLSSLPAPLYRCFDGSHGREGCGHYFERPKPVIFGHFGEPIGDRVILPLPSYLDRDAPPPEGPPNRLRRDGLPPRSQAFHAIASALVFLATLAALWLFVDRAMEGSPGDAPGAPDSPSPQSQIVPVGPRRSVPQPQPHHQPQPQRQPSDPARPRVK